jgi:hypothetical protein
VRFRRCAVCGLPVEAKRDMHPTCEIESGTDAMPLDQALVAVEQAGEEEWKKCARDYLRWLVLNRDEWTTDDFWRGMATHYPDVRVRERRLLGPLVRELISGKVIQKVGVTTSTRPIHHSATIYFYRRYRT